jgi:hypothetical protein
VILGAAAKGHILGKLEEEEEKETKKKQKVETITKQNVH